MGLCVLLSVAYLVVAVWSAGICCMAICCGKPLVRTMYMLRYSITVLLQFYYKIKYLGYIIKDIIYQHNTVKNWESLCKVTYSIFRR